MDQNFAPSGTPFSLYLKAKSDIYSIVQINTLPTIATAISVVAAFSAGLVADKTGRFWLPSYVVTIPLLIGVSLLVAWDVGEAGRLAGFMLTGFVGGEFPTAVWHYTCSLPQPYMTFGLHSIDNRYSHFPPDNWLGHCYNGKRCRGARCCDSKYERNRTGYCCWYANCSVPSIGGSEFPRRVYQHSCDHTSTTCVDYHDPYFELQRWQAGPWTI